MAAYGLHVFDPVYPDFDGERLWTSERGMYMEDVSAYGVAFEFTLERSWDEQAREARRIFKARQQDAIKCGRIVKPASARKDRSDYVRFLRAYDGSLPTDPASHGRIADVLSEDDPNGVSEDDVKNALRNARKLIGGGWRALAAYPAV